MVKINYILKIRNFFLAYILNNGKMAGHGVHSLQIQTDYVLLRMNIYSFSEETDPAPGKKLKEPKKARTVRNLLGLSPFLQYA